MLHSTICFSSLLLPVLLCWGSIARSQVGLSPLVVELQDNQGQAQAVISVENISDQEFRARVYPQPFTYDPEQGFQSLTTSPNDLAPYLQFSPRELVIPPKTTRLVRLLVRFPPNLPDGEYRTAILTENLTETSVRDAQGNQTQFAMSIATTVYARKGNLSANLAVEKVHFDPQRREIRLLVQNTGAASARPQLDWTLKQGAQILTQGTISATTVLADSQRFVGLEYPKDKQSAFPGGNYQLSGQFSWGGEENNQNTRPFNLNFSVPAQAATP